MSNVPVAPVPLGVDVDKTLHLNNVFETIKQELELHEVTAAAMAAHIGAGGIAHAVVNSFTDGFMSPALYTKLLGIQAGAQVNTLTSVFGRTGAVDILGFTEDTSPALTAQVAIEITPGVYRRVQLQNLPGSVGATGDMAKAVYDPGNIAADAFSMDNMLEGALTKVFTAAERAKLAAVEPNATADQTAAEVPFTPAGGLSATTVQEMGVELDVEKLSKAANLADLTDTAAARSNLIPDGAIATAMLAAGAVTEAKLAFPPVLRRSGYTYINIVNHPEGYTVNLAAGQHTIWVHNSGSGIPDGYRVKVYGAAQAPDDVYEDRRLTVMHMDGQNGRLEVFFPDRGGR